tara:strand:+ start:223 stop:477 length:255 start_codon:yes stop_codon:yes gene_type:complete
MGFNNYYLGWKNGGEEFYSLKGLRESVESDKELMDEIERGTRNYTFLKEFDSGSRTWLTPSVENGRLVLKKRWHEKMVDGCFGT